MNYSEIKLEEVNYTMSCNTVKSGQHYKSTMMLGRILPTSKAQLASFIRMSTPLSVLNLKDCKVIESLLNKYGFKGIYKYTKSKQWVRLQNNEDLIKALKLEIIGNK